MFDNLSAFEQNSAHDEPNSLVQIGHVSMPKLSIPSQQAPLPPSGYTHWSPTNSSIDSGETEKEDTSRTTTYAAHRLAMMNQVQDDKSFFNLPASSADLQPLEGNSANNSIFEFARSANAPYGQSADNGNNQMVGNSFSYEQDRQMDAKMQERLQYQMMMQRKMMYEENKAVSPAFRNSLPVQPPVNSHMHMGSSSIPSHHNVHQPSSYPDNVMYGGNKFPTRFTTGSSPTHLSSSTTTSMYSGAPVVHPGIRSSPMSGDYSNLRVTGVPGNGMMPQPSTYSSYGMVPQVAPSVNGRIYQVQFKCSIRNFTLGAHAPQSISVGDFVVVEADRGEDIGIVTDIMPMKTFIERRIYLKSTMDDEDNVIGRIIRPASPAERQLLPDKFRDEENVLQLCRELSYGTYRLPMMIHDVDYQFDRHKLTIFYSSESRIDFREFVRDLFSAYKARIWMKKVSSAKPIRVEQWAAMSLATGMQFSPERNGMEGNNNNMSVSNSMSMSMPSVNMSMNMPSVMH